MTSGLLIQPVSSLATNPTTCLPRWNLSFGPGKRMETVEVHWSVGLTRDLIQVNPAYVDMQSIDLKHELDVSWCWRLLLQQNYWFYLSQSVYMYINVYAIHTHTSKIAANFTLNTPWFVNYLKVGMKHNIQIFIYIYIIYIIYIYI